MKIEILDKPGLSPKQVALEARMSIEDHLYRAVVTVDSSLPIKEVLDDLRKIATNKFKAEHQRRKDGE